MPTHRDLVAGRDAAQARADAARLGRSHGERHHPSAEANAAGGSGGRPADHVASALKAEARAAAVLAVARRLAVGRPADDATLDHHAGLVLRLTREVAEARHEHAEQLHQVAALEGRLPLAARERPWPPWLRLLLLTVVAVCGGANLAAGLVNVTSDDVEFAVAYAAAVGAGLVGVAAALGRQLRRWELNALRPGEHVASGSRVPPLVVGLGLVFALALTVAVAAVRGSAAGEGGDVTVPVEVFLPDRVAPDATAEMPVDSPEGPMVPVWTWAALEGLLLAGALLLEYTSHMPWAQVWAERRRRSAIAQRRWLAARAELAAAWSGLKTAWDARAAADAAELVAGEATEVHAVAEIGTYRYENLAARPRDADPFAGIDGRGDGLAIPGCEEHQRIRARSGLDVRPLGPVEVVGGVPLDGDLLVPEILARARAELERPVARPELVPVRWDPAELTRRELGPDTGEWGPALPATAERRRGEGDRGGAARGNGRSADPVPPAGTGAGADR